MCGNFSVCNNKASVSQLEDTLVITCDSVKFIVVSVAL